MTPTLAMARAAYDQGKAGQDLTSLAGQAAAATPIVRHVVRFVCPFCARGRSSRRAASAHIARCFRNPAARSCRTCALYQPPESGDHHTGYPGCPEGCDAGRDLAAGLPVGCSDWEPLRALQPQDPTHAE